MISGLFFCAWYWLRLLFLSISGNLLSLKMPGAGKSVLALVCMAKSMQD